MTLRLLNTCGILSIALSSRVGMGLRTRTSSLDSGDALRHRSELKMAAALLGGGFALYLIECWYLTDTPILDEMETLSMGATNLMVAMMVLRII